EASRIGYVGRYLKPYGSRFTIEAVDHKHLLIRSHSQEGVHVWCDVTVVYVERRDVVIVAGGEGRVGTGEREHVGVEHTQCLLLHREGFAVERSTVHPLLMFGNAPIIVYRCASVFSGKAFVARARLANFLPEIDHNRTAVNGSADYHGGTSLPDVSGKEGRGHSLLVVVLHEMEHIVVDALQPLLYPVNGDGTTLSAYQVAQGVVKQNFVIEEIKGTLIQVFSVLVGIIDFSDKNDLRIYGLHLGYYPVPEFHRNHLRHVTTKAIYLAVCPEDEDVFHLVPGVRYRIE